MDYFKMLLFLSIHPAFSHLPLQKEGILFNSHSLYSASFLKGSSRRVMDLILHLPLQLSKQIECLERSEIIHVKIFEKLFNF
jgi:hypothetical protein